MLNKKKQLKTMSSRFNERIPKTKRKIMRSSLSFENLARLDQSLFEQTSSSPNPIKNDNPDSKIITRGMDGFVVYIL